MVLIPPSWMGVTLILPAILEESAAVSQALDINNIVYAVSTLLVLCLCRP